MNFTKTTSYSLHIMSYMAQNESMIMSASYLYRKLNIPYSYLRVILSELSKNRLVRSIKGRNGGFKLNRDRSEIFLTDIIQTTEGLESFEKCIMGFDSCPFNYGCFMHPVWTKMKKNILDILKKTSLADLMIRKKPNQ